MLRLVRMETDRWQASKHKSRPYVVDRADLIYMNSPHLKDKSFEFCGYWVATNLGHKEVWSLVHMACEAAEVRYQSLTPVKL